MIRRFLTILMGLYFCLIEAHATSFKEKLVDKKEEKKPSVSERFTPTPLKDLFLFTVMPIYSISDPSHVKLYNNVYPIVKAELNKIGLIQEKGIEDLFEAVFANVFISLNIQTVCEPMMEVSLTIQTLTTIKNSNLECVSPIWSEKVFISQSEEKNIPAAVQELLQTFAASYALANPEATTKPSFYIYSP